MVYWCVLIAIASLCLLTWHPKMGNYDTLRWQIQLKNACRELPNQLVGHYLMTVCLEQIKYMKYTSQDLTIPSHSKRYPWNWVKKTYIPFHAEKWRTDWKYLQRNIDIEDQEGNLFDRREMVVKGALKTTKHRPLAAFNIPVWLFLL